MTKGKIRQKKGETVGELMTPDPICLIATEPLTSAAERMRDENVGDVIVLDETTAEPCGIVTDRDIVVRGLADGGDPAGTTLGAICTRDLVTLEPDTPVDEAVDLMRKRAIRRIPVVEDGKAVGIVSIGDLAVARDPDSALADISAAPPTE